MNLVTLMWSLAATVLAGSFILIVLIVPQIGMVAHLSNAQAIIAAACLGAVAAVPIAQFVGKALLGKK